MLLLILRGNFRAYQELAMSAENFEQFWKEYLHDHAQTGTRVLHFFGNGVAIVALIVGTILLNPTIAVLGIGLGYLLAWSGHLLFEANRPKMFAGHPLWALQCEIRMLRLWLGGRLRKELAKGF